MSPTSTDGADGPTYRDRIAIEPGNPRIAYRPRRVLAKGAAGQRALAKLLAVDIQPLIEIEGLGELRPTSEQSYQAEEARRAVNERVPSLFAGLSDELRVHPIIVGVLGDDGPGEWFGADDVDDAPAVVRLLERGGITAHLNIVYFANDGRCCGVCPPHPAIGAALAANPFSANPYSANPYSANPYSANPYSANPYSANPYSANPYSANTVSLNVAATGKPPTSSVLPALQQEITPRSQTDRSNIVIGVLDSGLAGGPNDAYGLRPKELGEGEPALTRISGQADVPSADGDPYLDPVAGHGTFIAGIIEQLTPGCTIEVRKVFEPEGDVDVEHLFWELIFLVIDKNPAIVNMSFAGTGSGTTLFESLIKFLHEDTDIVFVGSAGNEGTCVEQFPAALPEVIAVGALSPDGPAPWSNYGPWVDACAPGTDLVSAFFAKFNGALPPINGVDSDNFVQWATWSGTSFAAPVVVAALARDMSTGPNPSARPAVRRVIQASHLARFPNMGTIVNY